MKIVTKKFKKKIVKNGIVIKDRPIKKISQKFTIRRINFKNSTDLQYDKAPCVVKIIYNYGRLPPEKIIKKILGYSKIPSTINEKWFLISGF